ncbi:site-specific DNA-methyltransferase [Candidatus Avelusimicrobium fimicolum]|uniref:site-specific DNA-methyltransferase n=1 Tax=Candidatus Avelusimicrobium fimicolum TaxID=3416216 RepID=UPI003D0F6B47
MKQKLNCDLTVVYTPLDTLTEYPNNPRQHDTKQLIKIQNSIEKFGFINPILVDEHNEIIAGHARLAAARLAHLPQVPVIRLEHLSAAQKKAYRIADNKLAELGTWSIENLQLEFQELEKLDLDFSLGITGFDMGDIDLILEGKEAKADPKANNIPFIPDDEVVTREGDIWILGEHRIICGNSLQKETLSQLMENKKADMVFTDPPYNVKINGHVCGAGNVQHKEFKFASGEMTVEEFTQFLKTSFELLCMFSKDGSLHYICMDWRHIKEIMTAAEVYDQFKNLCVWRKDNAGMGSFYRSQHELIFMFKHGKEPHINNVELGIHGRYRTNVWNYAGVNTPSAENAEKRAMHPTVKPVELIKDAILDASNRGGVVLDTFLGSGSTLIAAEKAGRICYGVELEPKYVDTAIRRYESLGEKYIAIHAASGKTYQELLSAKRTEGGKHD